MVILGLNSGFDYLGRPVDSGASALMVDGSVVAAIAEERLTREKYAGGFVNSAARVLEIGGVRECDINAVAVSLYQHPDALDAVTTTRVNRELGPDLRGRKFILRSHHLSHAASAFYQSPFECALVCVWDNEGSVIGEWAPDHLRRSERHSYYYGAGNKLTLISRELDGPNDVGFGQGYARFTRFVGLGNYTAAGKLMGLAAYGDPQRYAGLGSLWIPDDTGRLRSLLKARDRHLSVPLLFARCGLPPPSPEPDGHRRQEMRDLAAFVQHQLEVAAIRRLRALVKQTDAPALCIAGGVALNSVLNGKLQRELGVPVYVPPQPDDTGQALGNVILSHVFNLGSTVRAPWRLQQSNDLGGTCAPRDLQRLLNELCLPGKVTSITNIAEDAAETIASGAIVGWVHGRSEYGARALGHRSILADPRSAEMRNRINAVKRRESFRPVAPAVPNEVASKYFDIGPSPLWATMSGTVSVRPSAVKLIEAAVHVDGTARPQLVDRATKPLFHALLTAFGKRTGVPVLLNTSFNSAGEPIVETAEQACVSATSMGIDVLYVGDLRVDISRARL